MIDLNCDLGEGVGEDAAVLPFITTASLACGLHAGDGPTMRHTLHAARAAGVAVGAHPSYPDKANFGRRAMALSAEEVHDHVLYQVGALAAHARSAGLRVGHIKPHGALYHAAGADLQIARAVVTAAVSVCGGVLVIGFPGGALQTAAAERGLRFAAEAFADRGYGDDGRLLPRGTAGAQLDLDDDAVAARAVQMASQQAVRTQSGRVLPMPVHTICLHGDEPHAAARARAIRAAFAAAGVQVAPVTTWL